MEDISALTKTTKRRLHLFDSLRGKTSKPGVFWDIVVLTASDAAQKEVYEMQLKKKRESNHLPLSASYVVVADPPGYKIGNGGSTMVVIKDLYEQYHEKLWEKKIIILHAGGFSQRLPNASLLGKAFTPIPIGNPMYQALEMKLASYISFPEKIHGGGMFVSCCDSIEVYDDQDIPWTFSNEGFTALAHLSPISIGTTHGVFVLDTPIENSHVLWSCQKFLHKPSIEKMRSTENCIVKTSPREMVLTDSAFFISPPVAKQLLHFYKNNRPLKCEIDAYGDFLQALGNRSTSEYVKDQKNVFFEADSLQQMREEIYKSLHKSPLHAVVLAPVKEDFRENPVASIFFHIGTMPEYHKYFTEDKNFRKILGINSLISCKGIPQKFTGIEEKLDAESNIVRMNKHGAMTCSIRHLDYKTPCIMGSVLHSNIEVGQGTVIEYSYLNGSVTVGSDCIISNCILPPGSTVPSCTFMHTVSVKLGEYAGFVTVLFGNDDDIKKSVEAFDMLTYFGCSLKEVCPNLTTSHEKKITLWTTKLFPVCNTMEESGAKACTALRRISEHKKSGEKISMYVPTDNLLSMKDILQEKNVQNMLEFRMKLQDDINAVYRSSHLNHIETLVEELEAY